ncbi:MAG: DUF2232 domain-containing protein [Spirochaetaceae bacterium]|jgi:hypothetical protein|nr:DUF2232 domain-containing protein [Spirochaetaceae bacterium]
MYSPVTVAYLPAVIGAVISVVLNRTGFLGLLFLVPPGVIAYCYNGKTAWFCTFLVILGNGLVSLTLGVPLGYSPAVLWRDILYMAVMTGSLTWIVLPARAEGFLFSRIPGVYRLICGSLLGALSLVPVVASLRNSSGLYEFIRAQAEAVSALYAASAGADVVQRSLSEQYITPEAVLETVSLVSLRGGMVVSCMILFVVSRQLALGITWFIRRTKPGGSITGFHVPPWFIWALSCSLPGILVGVKTKTALLEIPAWNILVICSILYLAQGGGIAIYFLSRIRRPGARFLIHLLLIIVICSPGINAVFLGALALLGIAENWVPFRVPKTDGPSSTPGMEA